MRKELTLVSFFGIEIQCAPDSWVDNTTLAHLTVALPRETGRVQER